MFVTGCHRSGTSYLAMILDSVINGRRSRDLDATVDNPRGYFESTLLRGFNDRLLNMAGYTWDRPPLGEFNWNQGKYLLEAIRIKEEFRHYSLGRDWLDKDPRLSITMPIYKHLLLDHKPTVAAIRPPNEVQQSLHYRDGFSSNKGLMLWLLYNRSCSGFLREDKDLLVDYPELMNGSECGLTRMEQFLKRCDYDLVCSSVELIDQLKDSHRIHTEKRLRRRQHTSGNEGVPTGELFDYCQSIYETVQASGCSITALKEACHELPGFIVDMYHSVLSEGEPSLEYYRRTEQAGISNSCSTGDSELDAQLITTYSDLILAIQAMREELRANGPESVDALKQRIIDMENSSSWKFTAALRWIASVLKR